MAWLRIDDGFDSHPKILALGSDQRRWTWTRILVYTCRYRSPTIPANVTELVPRATPAFLRECVDLGLVDVTDTGAYEVHDWDTYNGSDPKIQVRERVRKHRENRNNGVTSDVTDALQDRYSRVGARARPVPNPSPSTYPAATTSTTDPPDPDAAAELAKAGWADSQITEAHAGRGIDLALDLLHQAQADPTCSSPGALAWTKYQAGATIEQPKPPKTCPECGIVIRPPTTLADHLWQTHDQAADQELAPPPTKEPA